MDDFGRRSCIDPVTYAVTTIEILQGALPYRVTGRLGDLMASDDYLPYEGQPSEFGSLIALTLSIIFFVVAIFGWLGF